MEDKAVIKQWIPLEANPELVSQFGVEGGWKFVDVYGLDPDLLTMVPKPVISVLLLYPLSPVYNASPLGVRVNGSKLLFIKQTVSNSCGTVAVLHALANNYDKLKVSDDSVLSRYVDKLRKSALTAMEDDEAPNANTKTNLHFICFVESGGYIYELDGRKSGPIKHQAVGSQDFLTAVSETVKTFIALSPNNLDFNMVALCAS